MKRKTRIPILAGVILASIALLIILFLAVMIKESGSSNTDWLQEYISIQNSPKNTENVKTVSNGTPVDNLDIGYQQALSDKIESVVEEGHYTLKNPLLILNPYGTNYCSLNLYFRSEIPGYLEYTISAENKEFPDFTRKITGTQKKVFKDHAYQVIGLIPGEKNRLTIKLYDKNDKIVDTASFSVYISKAASNGANRLDLEKTKQKQDVTDGLYALFGHGKDFNANVYLYDEYGILRSEFPIKSYRSDRLLFFDHSMVYSIAENEMIRVNSLGQIIGHYSFSGYELHHDFVYDEKHHKLLMLATKLDSKTIEDIILQLDLNSGKTSELIDFKTILPDTYKLAEKPSYRESIDWIHFNSIQIVNGKDLILSSRETSSIIRVNDIYHGAQLKYLISDVSMWKDSIYEPYLYKKSGEFTAHAGQHAVTYVEDNTLSNGQYYIYMFNNNMGYSGTKPSFKWDAYPGIGSPKKGMHSYYYKYLVDENTESFVLINSFQVPYSGYVSSAQDYKNNFIICSGTDYSFGEYNSSGELIRQFNFPKGEYTYRVFKYDFKDFWF